MKLFEEKIEVLKHDEDMFVIASSNTEKSLIVAHTYARLLEEGVHPKDIPRLTFSREAKKEIKKED